VVQVCLAGDRVTPRMSGALSLDREHEQPVDRVLIVEDDRILREVVAEYFAIAGYAVDTAAEGSAALACLRRHKANAIVTDLRMRGMDGRQLILACAADPDLAGIPVVVASGTPGDLSGSVRALPFAVLRKPIGMETLVATVAEAVRGPGAEQADPTCTTD
jgi:CheY-like chemotaxis protein